VPTSPEAEAIAKHARAVERVRIAVELLGGLIENETTADVSSVLLEIERVQTLLAKAIPDIE